MLLRVMKQVKGVLFQKGCGCKDSRGEEDSGQISLQR